jgi:hypothetical protein
MKFKLVEGLLDYFDLEEEINSAFDSLSEEELMSYYDDSVETGGAAIWIRPNGDTLRLDIHQNIGGIIFDNFCKEYFEQHPNDDYSEDDFCIEDAFAFNDKLVEKFKWIKFNSGTIYDDRYYVCIPDTITSQQHRAFESILEETQDESDGLMVLTPKNRQVYYKFDRYSPSDIVKRIRKFCVSGVLEESKLYEASIDPEGKYTDFGTGKVIDDNIFDDRPHIPDYDRLLSNPEYMAKKENLKGHIEMMSPKEYYEECANKIFNCSVESLVNGRKRDVVVNDEIKEIIVKYKRQVFLPVLNLAQQEQEGLHRMLVAAELFGWDHKFPVLVVEWVDEELANRRAKEKEDQRVRKYIKSAVEETLDYTFDNLEEFTDECKAQVDYKFDFIEEPVKSFSVKHNDDGYTEVEVNNVVYQFDTDKINVKPSRENSDNVDELEWDDLDIELDDLSDEEIKDLNDLDIDEFLKKYGM